MPTYILNIGSYKLMNFGERQISLRLDHNANPYGLGIDLLSCLSLDNQTNENKKPIEDTTMHKNPTTPSDSTPPLRCLIHDMLYLAGGFDSFRLAELDLDAIALYKSSMNRWGDS
jgi:hypothetical protein